MHIAVEGDVVEIIKMPFTVEAVTVDDKEKRKNGNEGKSVYPAAGETPPDIQIEIVCFTDHAHLKKCHRYIADYMHHVKENMERPIEL
jgi:hypothetical protein